MKKILYYLGYLSLLLPLPVLAIGGTSFGSTPEEPTISDVQPSTGPTTIKDWFGILVDVVGWIFTVTIVVGVAALIIGGLMYITAGGGDRAKTAGKLIIYAVVGIAVAALAWAIVNLVGNFFVGGTLL